MAVDLEAAGGAGTFLEQLSALRGSPAVVEIPTLADFGAPLAVPSGWGYAQAKADNVEELRRYLRIASVPALAYLDLHGNALYVDAGEGCRRRMRAALAEFERRRRDLEARLRELASEAEEARRDGRADRETARIVELVALGVKGYRESEGARVRLAELDRDAWREYLRILAGEGIEPAPRLAAQLRTLEARANGLSVAVRIRRDLERFEKGIRVKDRR